MKKIKNYIENKYEFDSIAEIIRKMIIKIID